MSSPSTENLTAEDGSRWCSDEAGRRDRLSAPCAQTKAGPLVAGTLSVNVRINYK